MTQVIPLLVRDFNDKVSLESIKKEVEEEYKNQNVNCNNKRLNADKVAESMFEASDLLKNR